MMAVTAFTTDFIGVSTRTGELDRAAVRRLSIAERKAVTWISVTPPVGETGS
jgi:hypothetical protein